MQKKGIFQPATIKKIALTNTLLVLYFALPNLSSFVLIAGLAGLVFCSECVQKMFEETQEKCWFDVNKQFNSYLETSYSKQFLVILGAWLVSHLIYLIPSWFFIVVFVELWASWELLVALGANDVLELVWTQIQSVEQSIKKFMNMIPRYQGE